MYDDQAFVVSVAVIGVRVSTGSATRHWSCPCTMWVLGSIGSGPLAGTLSTRDNITKVKWGTDVKQLLQTKELRIYI